ncbi:MAG TPA: TfoX/Sxy family protein [Amycolatopsis sp.]|nr:TfoX/Sxy family protein [Amycolatopsis sp.]
MAYDRELADRIRGVLGGEQELHEQAMFGGLGFMVRGNMAVAASGQGGLMVRVNPDDADPLIDDVHVRPMVMRGREMRGWLMVDTDAVSSDDELGQWVARGVTYARSLPAKASRA